MKALLLLLLIFMVGCASQSRLDELYLVETEIFLDGVINSKPRLVVTRGESSSVFLHSDKKDMLLELNVEEDKNQNFIVKASFCHDVDALNDNELVDLDSCSKLNKMMAKSLSGKFSEFRLSDKNNLVKEKFKFKVTKIKQEDLLGEF